MHILYKLLSYNTSIMENVFLTIQIMATLHEDNRYRRTKEGNVKTPNFNFY
jgi:hypothetical protein